MMVQLMLGEYAVGGVDVDVVGRCVGGVDGLVMR